jgi:FimV-like protein
MSQVAGAEESALAQARQALEAGDFGRARQLLRRLASGDDANVQKEAKALLSRTRPDPVIVWLSLGCVLFFLAVIYLTIWHR